MKSLAMVGGDAARGGHHTSTSFGNQRGKCTVAKATLLNIIISGELIMIVTAIT